MAIPVTCAGCGHKASAPDAAAGRKAKCPKCGAAVVVPAAGPQAKPAGAATAVKPPPAPGPVMPPVVAAVAPAPVSPPSWSSGPIVAEPVQPCPFCGEQILAVAKKCRFCGEVLDPAMRAAEEARRLAEASARTPFAPAAASSAASTTVVVQQAGYRFPHLLHLVLTLVTCGLWLPVWIVHWICHEIFG